jgi:thiamine kinase-like enzyme
LQPYIEAHRGRSVLTHIDAVPDNFLFVGDEVRLIDWEYAGMQDPHVDIAMFCIYSLYQRSQVDELINIYFEGQCPLETRIKIYCYIAVCGLLWSNWCEYKRCLGIEFGEYSIRQYRYAKDYYRLVQTLWAEQGGADDGTG